MHPRLLRAKAQVSLEEMARRLGIRAADLRTLEKTGLRFWEIGDLRKYVQTLGLRLESVAVTPDGKREVLS